MGESWRRRGEQVLRHPVTRAGLLRRWLRLVGRTGLVLASVAALIVTGYAWTLSRQFDASLTTSAVLDHPGYARRAGPRGPMNVLLVGLDSRTDAQGNLLPPQVLAALHAGGNSGELNADTLILVHVPAEPTQPTVACRFPATLMSPCPVSVLTRLILPTGAECSTRSRRSRRRASTDLSWNGWLARPVRGNSCRPWSSSPASPSTTTPRSTWPGSTI